MTGIDGAESATPLWVGTSWKMTKTLAEAVAYVDELAAFAIPSDLRAFVLPPHTALAAVRERLPDQSAVLLGAQNAHWEPEGPATGEVSMRMVRDAGAGIVEIGHSERRARFGETDETVAAKVAAAIAHHLVPLVCVGEPLEVRNAGRAQAYVCDQLRAALSQVDPGAVSETIVAYEPVWAIGATGNPAAPDQVMPVIAAIRRLAASISGGRSLRAVLYGGGVGPDNIAELLSDPGLDGVFVGRAGWEASGFTDLLDRCAPIARQRVAA